MGDALPVPGAGLYISLISPSRWGFGALASTIKLNRIAFFLPPAHADGLWKHTSGQWLQDIAAMLVIAVVLLIVARIQLGRIGPRARKQ